MPCILPQAMRDFKEKLQNEGKTFTSLRQMTASERVKMFSDAFNSFNGDTTGEWFNREYERKLLLPNQRESLKKLADTLAKKGKDTKNHKLLYEKINGMKTAYNPKEGKPFLQGLAKAQLGFDILQEDARALFNTTQTLAQQKKELDGIARETGAAGWNDLNNEQYEKLIADESNYQKMMEFGKKQAEFNEQIEQAYFNVKQPSFIEKLAGTFTAIKASWDASFGRQLVKGWYAGNFKGAGRQWMAGMQAWNAEKANATLAMIYSHPYYTSGKLNELGLKLGGTETEFFPDNFISGKSSILTDQDGKPLTGTKAIYELFVRSDRMYSTGVLFAKFQAGVQALDSANGNVNALKAMDMGGAINGLFGKVNIPGLNERGQKIAGVFLFAPRWVASQVRNLIDAPKYAAIYAANKLRGHGGLNQAQQMRLRSAVYNIIATALLSNIISAALRSDDDEFDGFLDALANQFDPRSSDFGKLRIGNLRLDISLGTNAIITMLSRVITGQTKTGDGLIANKSRFQSAWQWLHYKESPMIANVENLVKVINAQFTGETAKDVIGQDMPAWKFALDAVLPISVTGMIEAGINAIEADSDKRASVLIGGAASVIADIFGINSQFYDATEKPMNKGKSADVIGEEIKVARHNKTESGSNPRPPSVELSENAAIKTELPTSVAKKAEREFSALFLRRERALFETSAYKRANYADKMNMIRKVRSGAYDDIKKKYGIKRKKKK